MAKSSAPILYDDRLDTLGKVPGAGMKVCCGGIVGMGESRAARAGLIAQLAALNPAPESVPINLLVRIPGTPMSGLPALDPIEFVRTIAVARICLPTSMVRLSAGRQEMPDYLQAMCFFAGANSIFTETSCLPRRIRIPTRIVSFLPTLACIPWKPPIRRPCAHWPEAPKGRAFYLYPSIITSHLHNRAVDVASLVYDNGYH